MMTSSFEKNRLFTALKLLPNIVRRDLQAHQRWVSQI